MEDKGNPTSIMTRLFGNETNIDVKNLDIERVDDEQTIKKNDDDLNGTSRFCLGKFLEARIWSIWTMLQPHKNRSP